MKASYIRTLKGHKGPVTNVRFTNEEKGYGMLVKRYEGPHGYPVHDVAVSQDNSQFASVGGDKGAFVWDVTSGKVIAKYFGHEYRINTVRYNEEATILVTGSYDKTVRCWDRRSWNKAPVQVMKEAKDSITSLIVTDHEIIASSTDHFVRLYDMRMGRVSEDNLHMPITDISLSHDGKCILASCMGSPKHDGCLRLLMKDTGAQLNMYRGHTHTSYAIRNGFTISDAHVFSGSEDNTAYVWDLVESAVVAKLEGHKAVVSAVEPHPKKDIVLTSSFDGTVGVWTLTA